ncbi:MAG TPA: peptidyl-prolyl cis-trans isomerase, partial [Bacteroidia bacterium]|nr:peptidyl-prolyl cis-trans isomerase [Bacteroidia bacterium]
LSHSASNATKVKLGVIDRKIEASNETFEAWYQKANAFAGKNSASVDIAAFDKAAQTAGYTSRTADNIKEIDRNINGIGNNCRDVVRWIYSAKPNEVSRSFRVDNKYIVAMVKYIAPQGYRTIETAKDLVTAGAIREKKAQTLIEKANAALASNKNIDALAAKLNTQVIPVQSVNFGSQYVPGLGPEPKVIGQLVTLKQGEVSKPIEGSQGVFVIMAETVSKPAEIKDFSSTKQTLMQQNGNRFYEVFNALKEKANVKDNRGRFY